LIDVGREIGFNIAFFSENST